MRNTTYILGAGASCNALPLLATMSKRMLLLLETLRHIAREIVDTIRKNSSIDWTVKENLQAKMRIAVKKYYETTAIHLIWN